MGCVFVAVFLLISSESQEFPLAIGQSHHHHGIIVAKYATVPLPGQGSLGLFTTRICAAIIQRGSMSRPRRDGEADRHFGNAGRHLRLEHARFELQPTTYNRCVAADAGFASPDKRTLSPPSTSGNLHRGLVVLWCAPRAVACAAGSEMVFARAVLGERLWIEKTPAVQTNLA